MSKRFIVVLLSVLMAAGCMAAGMGESVLSEEGAAVEPVFVLPDADGWEQEKGRSLGVSVKDGKTLLFTESMEQLWEFGILSSGKMTARFAENAEEAFSGLSVFLLNGDGQVVETAYVEPPLTEGAVVSWNLAPGRYYIRMMFADDSPVYQSVFVSLYCDAVAESLPLG